MEKVIDLVGPFGKYQKFVLILAGFIASFTATTIYSTIFSAVDPGLICDFNNGSTVIKDLPNQCDIWEIVKNNQKLNQSTPYECYFDKKYYDLTMVNDWELICKQAALASLTQTLYMVGTVCGLGIGYFSDKFGRKNSSVVLALLLSVLLTLSEILQLKQLGISNTTLYVIYCIVQFLVGAFAKVCYY